MSHTSIHEASRSRAGSLLRVLAVYLLALAVGGAVALATAGRGVLESAALADVAATLVVFLGSRWYDNTSLYDAYWSVAPPFLLLWFVVHPGGAGVELPSGGNALRLLLLGVPLLAWAVRLTWNWARGWHGLHEEDWRYADFRRLGGLYWPLSLFGLHLFPTAQVFLGMVPAAWAAREASPPGALAWLGAAVVTGAVVLQGVADEQLRRFVARGERGAVLREGLWARSRHPNYLGEIGVWLGVLLAGLDAGAPGWAAAGFVAITAMFVFVSIPLMERRQLAKRPGYQRVVDEVPMLLPRLG